MDHAERDRAEAQRAGDLADELQRIQAEEAALHARRTRVLAEAWALAEAQKARIPSTASRLRDMPLRSMAAELGMAVRVNDRTMQSHMWDAHVLATEFETTLAALDDGRITRAHANAIVDTGGAIDEPSARAAFEQKVLGYAETTTAARTRAYARSQADVFNPRTMQERHDLALQGRRIWVTDLDHGMSLLSHLLPTVMAHGILDRTTQQAKQIKQIDAAHRLEVEESRKVERATKTAAGDAIQAGAGEGDASVSDTDTLWFDERTIDQIRADLVADMLLTGSPLIDPTLDALPGGLGAIRARVQVTVPVTTLTGVTSGGAELDGISPVDPETAKRLAGTAPGWDRVLTDPVTGIVLAVDRYEVSAAQRRFLNARDRHCRAPGCRKPARLCDHDHTHDHALGGKTELCNLACLCKRHHTLKHATDWRVKQLPGGALEFTSPSGRTYLDSPTPRVVFLPSEGPAAPF
ncbi:HNH endonuclease signature motif containing protein [Microbacterium yannicii]|uniref:HNH endonuclease signature motif containing protein n=1 Tax=Microbacterium yannicii TaxID=671622 RepID=UPI00058EFB21|nr:HNH endonuclease signature motif containing protein [Microbacterium yannicii]